MIFISSVRGSKALMSFVYCFFQFRRPLGLSRRLTPPKKMENLAAVSAREEYKAAAEERERNEYSFAKRQ